MHPLTRQPTLESIRSWWSDRNPAGPTISIHAAAKPLIKALYHRQVLDFIRRNCGIPLSKETVETCASYLSYKYISHTTKSTILRELSQRAVSESEALTMVDSRVLGIVGELLRSPDPNVQIATCWLLGNLVYHRSTAIAIMGMNPCPHLVAILSATNLQVLESALYALSCITQWWDGAQAAVTAKTVDYLEDLLVSPRTQIRRHACVTLERLASHKSTMVAIRRINPCLKLVPLLRDENLDVVEVATRSLGLIATSPEGAQVAVNANVADSLAELLEASNEKVRRWACELVAQIARHDSTRQIILDTDLYAPLVRLLRDEHVAVVEGAVKALNGIARSREGAQSTVDADVLEFVAELLDSPNHDVRRWTCKVLGARIIIPAIDSATHLLKSPDVGVREWACEILGGLAYHAFTRDAVLEVKPCVHLVSLLHDESLGVVESAAKALNWIAHSSEGAQAAVEGNVLDFVADLLESPSVEVRAWTCEMLAGLASHERTMNAVFGIKPCAQLVLLLHDKSFRVTGSAAKALNWIIRSPECARDTMDANILDCMADLLESSNEEGRRWMCWILAQLAENESTKDAVLGVKPCLRLISRLRDENLAVIESAAKALNWIAKSPQGSQDVLDANLVDRLAELVRSSGTLIWSWGCDVLEQLACQRTLAALLRGGHTTEIEHAAKVLHLLGSHGGAQAAVDEHLTNTVAKLLEFPNAWVQDARRNSLEELMSRESTVTVVLSTKRFARLVSFLHYRNPTVVERVVKILYGISGSPQGAQAVVHANTLDCVVELLESPSTVLQTWACAILDRLSSHEIAAEAILGVNPYQRLVSLLRDEGLKQSAEYALSGISRFPEGAQAVMEAKILDVAEFLRSSNSRVREKECGTLTILASQEPTMAIVISLIPRMLVSLLRDENTDIVENAAQGLCYIISRSPEGAQAALNADVLGCISDLLDSATDGVRNWICAMLHQLSSHKTTLTAVLDVKPCRRLVALTRHRDLNLRASALFALGKITESSAGVAAVATTEIFATLSDLMESPDREVRLRTCILLKNIMRQASPEL
ncbi:armadillo-type protein [Mycena rosella]|uniref:Armadillo-type protein n=1 Tax=Mycena rosella TaxID=1033263 RepID=A0AAD7DS05_MYCRO|nr:armadillo-type protein [Mycena rosella]